jgi:hypothetical protein
MGIFADKPGVENLLPGIGQNAIRVEMASLCPLAPDPLTLAKPE